MQGFSERDMRRIGSAVRRTEGVRREERHPQAPLVVPGGRLEADVRVASATPAQVNAFGVPQYPGFISRRDRLAGWVDVSAVLVEGLNGEDLEARRYEAHAVAVDPTTSLIVFAVDFCCGAASSSGDGSGASGSGSSNPCDNCQTNTIVEYSCVDWATGNILSTWSVLDPSDCQVSGSDATASPPCPPGSIRLVTNVCSVKSGGSTSGGGGGGGTVSPLPCGDCAAGPRQWLLDLSSAAITIGGCPDCGRFKAPWTLTFSGGCEWDSPAFGGTGFCGAGPGTLPVWILTYTVMLGDWNLVIPNGTPGGLVIYRRDPSTPWNCLGPNTMVLHSSTADCNWPATVTLTPV